MLLAVLNFLNRSSIIIQDLSFLEDEDVKVDDRGNIELDRDDISACAEIKDGEEVDLLDVDLST